MYDLVAVSSTFLVNSFSRPFGPVSSSPRALASATIAAAAACSGDSCRPGLLITLAWTDSVRCHHSQCPSRRISARVSGKKHSRSTVPAPGCRSDTSLKWLERHRMLRGDGARRSAETSVVALRHELKLRPA